MYRVTTRQRQRYAATREAKAAKRLDSDPRPPVPNIPKESGAWDPPRGRNAAAAIRERLGEKV